MIQLTRYTSLLITLWLAACNRQPPSSATLKTLSGYAFGSSYTLKYSGPHEASSIKAQVDQFLRDFDQEFSTYRPDSVITRFNELKPGTHLNVSPRFIAMLKLAKTLNEETGGAFDPSLGKSIQLWGFGGSDRKNPPSRFEIQKSKTNTKMDSIVWDDKKQEAWKKESVVLDVNAFAPGWAADLLGQQLQQQGIQNFMIDISGEILFHGSRPDHTPWIGGIETPSEKTTGSVHLAFRITNLALATSGHYRQYRMQNGKKKSHILDPISHQPIESEISSASVIADTAVRADAWSTAMMVKGEKGLDDAEKKGIKAYLIRTRSDETLTPIMNSSMKGFLQSNRI